MKKRVKIKLIKSKNRTIYLARYLVYFVKLFVWKIRHKPKWKRTAKISAITFICLIISFAGFLGIKKILSIPRAPKIKIADSNSPFIYTAKAKEFEVSLGDKKTNTPKIEFSVSENKITFTPASGREKINEPTIEDKALIFREVYPKVDYKYQTTPKGIKEEIIIKQPTVIKQFPFYLDFEGVKPKYIAENLAGGVFYDENNNYLFHFEKPFAYDSAGVRTEDVQLLVKRDVETKKYVAIIGIDPTWIDSPERVYPIYIDPTVVHDTSSEFATGQLNRVKDTGSGSSPNLETYYQELPADEHTVGLWHMDEASGNALDSSGNGFSAVPTGATVTTGILGNARSFSGSGQYLTVTDNDKLDPSTISIEAWINPSSLVAGNIVSKTNTAYRFRTLADGTIQFLDRGTTNSIVTTETVSTSEWSHIAVTGDSSGLKIYINGKLSISNSTAYGGTNVADNVIIGCYNATDTECFPGLIDEVRISNIARSPEEIKLAAQRRPYSIYTSDSINLGSDVYSLDSLEWTELGVQTGDGETVSSSTDLVSQWNFNETSGTAANNDAEGTSCGGTPANCDGTLTGFSNTTGQDVAASSGWTSDNRRWGAGGLMFNGSSDYISITDNSALAPSSQMSIETWFKYDSSISGGAILNRRTSGNVGGYTLELSANNGIRFYIYTSAWQSVYTGVNSLDPGQWYHVTGTYDGSSLKIYVNGKLIQETTGVTGSINNPVTPLVWIGRNIATTTIYFDGNIDSTRIYSSALSASETLANYNAGQIEFQTRTSADGSTWEAWKPTTGETAIESYDSGESSNWQYRKSISISHTGSAVTEYQILIDNLDTSTLISNNKLQSDCGDLRFSNTNGTLLPYFIVGNTCNTTATQVWVQVDSIPNGGTTIYMFYGNPAAENYSNEMKTFSYSTEKPVAYVLDSTVDQLEVISLEPDNSITHNSVTRSLNKYSTSNFTSISQFGSITAKKPFNADDASEDTDGIVPVSWAGTEFLFTARSTATYTFYAIAPWGNATVDIYHAGTDCTGNSVTSSGATINCAITLGAVRIASTTPVLIFSETTTTDPTVLRPSSTNKWIGTGGTSYVTSGSSGADYRYFNSSLATEQDPADLAADSSASLGGGSYGGAPAFLARSTNYSIGVNQYGDGDGSDGHMYMGLIDMGTRYGSAVSNTDYVSIASDQPATCTLYNASTHAQVSTGTASSSNSSVYFLGFGTGATVSIIAAPWYMECDYPVAAMYQKGLNSESKLSSTAMMRQFTYPTPSVGSPGAENTYASHTGSWISIAADQIGLLTPSLDTATKIEGTGSQKITTGTSQIDPYTVASWHLDETSGTGAYLKDSSANANDGTPTGTTVVNGITGKARDFNGTSDYVQVSAGSGSPLDLDANPVTMEAWIRPDNVTANQLIISRGQYGNQGYGLRLNTTSKINLGVHGGSNFDGLTTLVTGRWYHVVGIINNTSSAIYINGKLDQTGTVNVVASDLNFHLGSSWDGATQAYFYDGMIDEVRISNVVRSAEEIAEAYRMGRDHKLSRTITSTDLSAKGKLPFYIAADRPGTYLEASVGESNYVNQETDVNTVGYWHLEEKSGSGAYLKDSSSYDNNGTPSGAAFTQGKIGGARKFDGLDDYISIAHDSTLEPSNLSMEAWINVDSSITPEVYGVIIDKPHSSHVDPYYNYHIRLDNLTNTNPDLLSCVMVGVGGGNDCISLTSSITKNSWHHIVVTFDETTQKLYLDGQLRGSVTNVGSIYYSQQSLYIGAFKNLTNGNFPGIIDEVRISNTARTADEVRQAYEIGARTHPITIDFAASLDSGNLITGSGDTSFTVDATSYGLNSMGSNLYEEDKIIVKENVDGTEYIAQGDVTAITASTGAATVDAWDTGSTFPTGGYTVNATVFKWQREEWDITKPLDSQINAITNLTLRATNGNEGRTIWLDDLKSSGDYLTDESGSTITSTVQDYFQYRAILSSTDTNVAPSLTSVTLNYTENFAPGAPTINASYLPDKLKTADTTPEIRFAATDTEANDLSYQVQWDTDSSFPAPSSAVSDTDAGFSNITTPADTDPFNSGDTVSYIFQSALTNSTTYFYKIRAKDPGGSNTYGNWSGIRSFTIDTSLTGGNAWFETHADQFTTDTLTGNAQVNDSGNYIEVSATTGTATSTAITAANINSSASTWGHMSFTDDETFGDITYKVYYDVTGTPTIIPDVDLPGNSTGFDTSPIDLSGLSTTTYSILYAYADLTYSGGSPQLQDWTISFNLKPTAPTNLLTEGLTNPTNVSDTTPEFSALCNDPDTGQVLNKYQIQVDNDSDFSSTLWDSGSSGTSMTDCTAGNRSQDITYGESALTLDGTTYYWKIKFWDNLGLEGVWDTESATFAMASHLTPSSCTIQENPDDSSLTLSWVDNSTIETQYRIERNVSAAGFLFLINKIADSQSHEDTDVSQGNTYQYRVRAENGTNTDWCTTSTLTLGAGTFELEGLNFQGVNIE